MNRNSICVSVFFSFFTFSALAQSVEEPTATPFTPTAGQNAMEKVETTVNDIVNKNTLVVDFDKGSARVTERQQSALRALVDGLDANSDGQTVYVVSYADELVAKEGAKKTALSKSAVKLGDQRLAVVKAALKKLKLKGKMVETSLAHEPATLKAAAKLPSAMLSSAIVHGKQIDDPKLTDAAEVIRNRGGEGKVVVYIQR